MARRKSVTGSWKLSEPILDGGHYFDSMLKTYNEDGSLSGQATVRKKGLLWNGSPISVSYGGTWSINDTALTENMVAQQSVLGLWATEATGVSISTLSFPDKDTMVQTDAETGTQARFERLR